MSGTVPPIPPPLGTNTGSRSNSNVNRVDTMPNIDTINTSPTINVSRSVVDDDLLLPQLLDSSHKYGPFVPMSNLSTPANPLPKRPSDTRDTKIAGLRLKFNAFKELEGEKVNGTYTRLKCLLNDLENNRVIISQSEVNATFVNSLTRKWLSINQTQRAKNSIKNDSLATLYGKYHYKEGLIDDIYASETQRFTIQASSLKALISNNHFQDSDSDVEENNRTSNEFMAYLNVEYHERALLANQKRFYKRIDELTKGKNDKGKGDKGKSDKGLVSELFNWDDKSVSSEDEGITKFKAFVAIAEDEPSVGKSDARSVNLENESLKDEISDLKKVISKQIHGNIIKSLRGKDRRKENNSSKEVLFTKADVSTSESSPRITSDSEDDISQASSSKTLKQKDYLKRFVWYLDSGCSRHITGVKQYLHRYSKESGPKVVFGDNSSGDTEGYGSINCNGITFTKVAYVNGLKHNLISISQLCDANFKVLFTKTQVTIFNEKDEVVLIAPRRRDVYVILQYRK
ncbi:hypothetical protein Tco_1259795 [Tanacetum coccineum]